MTLTSQYSGGILGGGEDFYKFEMAAERYIPLFWKFVLYDLAQFGYMAGLHNDSYIPPLDLFYMGGTALTIGTGLRGYSERSVGPLTSAGDPIGGRIQSKFTTEIRVPLVPNPTVYGLGFAEALINAIMKKVRTTQYKRHLPLIAKLSQRTINRDFRYPRDWGL